MSLAPASSFVMSPVEYRLPFAKQHQGEDHRQSWLRRRWEPNHGPHAKWTCRLMDGPRWRCVWRWSLGERGGDTIIESCLSPRGDKMVLLATTLFSRQERWRRLEARDVDDGVLSVWDCRTGERIARCSGHEGQILCTAFSPNGSMVASGGEGGAVFVWAPAGADLNVKPSPVPAPLHHRMGKGLGRSWVTGPSRNIAFSTILSWPDNRRTGAVCSGQG